MIQGTKKDLSTRIYILKENALSAKATVCTERARIYTDVYIENEAKTIIMKRALALFETLKRMTIFIDEGELIVGNHSSELRAAPVFPEYAVSWILNELDEFEKRPGDSFYLSGTKKKEIKDICTYWHGKTLIEKGYELMPELMKEIHEVQIIRAEGNLTSGDGHIAVNFEKILEIGIKGYLELVRKQRKMLRLENQQDLKKEQFYKALEIGLKGIKTFIERFENLSLLLSKTENDPQRKEELQRISNICNNVKQYPPRNFYEALQLVYFIQLILQIESNGHSVSLGRMDQYLYPFYKKDRDNNAITEEFTTELLENTWIKLYSINKIRPWSHTRYSAGSPLYQNVTIGGQGRHGEDAVNELSYHILRSVGKMKLTQPNLSVRYHRGMSDDFMKECIKVIEKGFGMPAFKNDEIVIPSLIGIGVEKKDAYNYSAIGCIEVAVPGKWGYRCTGMSFLNLMRVFLAALNNGYDTESGKTFHKGTGKFEDFKSFEEVMKAWKKQIEFYARATVAIDTVVDTALEENVPDVICSAFIDNCIKHGKTVKEGGAKYDFISGLQVGIANLGNSLAAIKKLVFEDKKITKRQLMKNLLNNFNGLEGEKIRQLLLNYAPKYGNDVDYVDNLLREAYMYFIDELDRYHNTRYSRGSIGGKYYAGTSSISANVPSGSVVPATPDGRKAYTPLAEGSSPSAGTDVQGPTAVFKSVSKLPTNKILGGVLLNQKMSPLAIKNERDKEKLLLLLRTFFDDLKGWHVQYNIVSKETLINAKKNPENYRDLVVRVAGYSAFFTTLSPDMQDDIIARTEHTL
ncbi:MAG: formate acetyltransferase [Spirochaetes bacterium DG_61]|nr:MAG: formate acetyltransferase [Spirochaetes bacterium DG_61]